MSRRSPPPRPARRTRWRLPVLLSAVLVFTGAAAALLPGTASAQPFQVGQYYHLIAVHSNKALDIANASTSPGATVQQWDQNPNGQNQHFRFESSGSGYYRVIARHSNMALDVYEWNANNGADIVQWTDLNGTNQQWTVINRGNNEISLVNRFSDKALDVWENSQANGARLSQWDSTGNANQRFRLVPVDGGGGQPPPPPPPPTGGCGSGTGDTEVNQSGSTFTATRGGTQLYSGSNYLQAINAAINGLQRPQQQRVVVRASGNIGNNAVNLPSNTSFEVCGTMTAGNSSGNGAVQSINATNVRVPYLTLRGTPYFGLRFAGQTNLHLGELDIRLNNSGIGVRFERDLAGSSNVRIDNVFVSGTSSHGVETWHVDGLTIGTITARDTGYAGLLLNQSRNATIGLVDGVNTGSGTGYATFRTANRNGRIGNDYPTNIRVGEVRSQGGGRGIFCVSESGGLVIDRITLANNGNNSILIENCYNVTIAAQSGTINGGGEVRLAARSEFPNTRDVSIRNLTVTNVGLRESPCGINISWVNITRNGNSPLNIC